MIIKGNEVSMVLSDLNGPIFNPSDHLFLPKFWQLKKIFQKLVWGQDFQAWIFDIHLFAPL